MTKKHTAKGANKNSHKLTLAPTDVDAGLMWLEGLGEPKFRDSVLQELYRKMRERDEIEWFENIHGRTDKGVDYLLIENSSLGRKVIGVQIKGKPITRSGGSGTLSAVQIASECVAAMQHEFVVQGARHRLDSIGVWCSAHVTQDAEEEFNGSSIFPVGEECGRWSRR